MSWRAALLLFVLLVPVFNLLTVIALPTALNHLVMQRIAERGIEGANQPDPRAAAQARQAEVIARRGINVALPAPRADANARTVVRPSPDLLYTACVFDLSHGPLRITAPVQASYVSVSGFADNTNNFFALNDSSASVGSDGQKRFDILLTRDATMSAPSGARVVLAPSTRGLILFRSLITDEAALPWLQNQFQAQQRCDPL